jgi:hypothetical protein
MVKSKFTFFQMQVKSTFTNASKLTEPRFRNAPKVLNAINPKFRSSTVRS